MKKRFVRTPDTVNTTPVIGNNILTSIKGLSINGKKYSKSQYQDLCIEAAENIALASFNNEAELEKLLSINGCYDNAFSINILSKLSECYEDRKLKEIDKMVLSPVSSANVIGITIKQDIVNAVLRKYANTGLATVEKIAVSNNECIEDKYEDEIIIDD